MFPFAELFLSPLGVGIIILMLLIEWQAMVQIKWQPLFRALGDVVVASAVSSVVIVLLSRLLLTLENPLFVIVAAFAVAVIVEGFVLMLIRKRKASASYMAALIANAVSFIFLLIFYLSFLAM
ncbi:hypothetical protein [Chloroflexus aggregans]|uniref:Uncharacterized protein n=1 Tax=Chloroflexus aggregans (strain MD-66 / DSM 9485) TaxID=326427 RepID=B8G7L5_CHLAD|nr:hypothetical protein [Chloroflexus aggregans]ACL26050.1 conserved hypothetical protein [Chloroflexus aggregans DSM 9485]